MGLLSPLFLFGLLSIALPIWLHRLQSQTTEREKFSSTMLLEASKQRIHVRRKLKYLLLMALRILFLTILVLAFTRPVFLLPPQTVTSEASTHHVIVLDTSFSMHEGDSFKQALQLAENIINNMSSTDQASIYSASTSVTAIAPLTVDQMALKTSLQGLTPDHGRLDLGAMISALNGLIEPSQESITLHLISDFQQSGQALRFADMIPDTINGRLMQLNIQPVKSHHASNWSVSSLLATTNNTVRAGITNHSSEDASIEKTLSLSINDVVQQELQQTLSSSAGGTSFVLFEDLEFASGDNKIELKISSNDSLAEDDIHFGVFDNSPPAPVLLLTANPDSLAVTYISAALETAPRGYKVQTTAINDLDTRILQRYPWLIIDDLGTITPALEQALETYLSNGGSILAALGERSGYLSQLPISKHSLLQNPSLSNNHNISIQQVNTSHPALETPVGWNNVTFSQSLTLEPNDSDSILLGLDGGNPLLLEQSIGLGRLVLLNTRLDNSWSDLPVKPVFVSFMAEMAHYLSKEDVLSKQQTINSFLQIGQTGTASGQVFDPKGKNLSSLKATTNTQSIALQLTGHYQLFTSGGEVLIAVNPDIRESNLEPMLPETLQNWENTVNNTIVNSDHSTSINASSAQDHKTREFEIGRILLILLVIVVLTESLLSNRYLRSQ